MLGSVSKEVVSVFCGEFESDVRFKPKPKHLSLSLSLNISLSLSLSLSLNPFHELGTPRARIEAIGAGGAVAAT